MTDDSRIARTLRLSVTPRSAATLAFALYSAVAFVFFGLRILTTPGTQYVGYLADPEIFIWSFGWWPHALLHGDNPFVTHAIWAPHGVDLTWTTSVPGLAYLFAPITLLLGAASSYDVAATLAPALDALAAYLLCRYLTRAFWPAFVGGYLFGFSSYILGQTEGHPHMTGVFALPLLALAIVRYLDDDLQARGLILRVGPLLAFQLLVSTEVTLMLAVVLVATAALAFALVPSRRSRMRSLVLPLAGAGALAAVLASPFLTYALVGFQTSAFHPPELYVGDLVNLVVPTNQQALGRLATGLSSRFPGNDSEQGLFLGPILLLVTLYAVRRGRLPAGRFLLAAFVTALVASLGADLVVAGSHSIWLPWVLLEHRAPFNNVLPARFALFMWLAVAPIAAIATAGVSRRWIRVALPTLAMLALVPNPSSGKWATSYSVPAFLSDASYRGCIDPGETVLPLPISSGGNANLWQVASGFRFSLAGGYVAPSPPQPFLAPADIATVAIGYDLGPDQAAALRTFIRVEGVTAIVVDRNFFSRYAGALDGLAAPRDIGGVLFYRLSPAAPSCG
ncbi:MAG: hypothetical protein WCH31_09485 [Actinomycetes bacterium]